MDDAFVNLMNSLGIFGKIILILIVAIPIIYGIYRFFANQKKTYDNKIANDTIKSEEDKKLLNDINGLITTVSKLSDNIDGIAKQNNEIKLEFNDRINQLNDKIDAHHKESCDGDDAIKNEIKSHTNDLNSMKKKMDISDEKVDLLIESDKESNRAFITNSYYESIELGYIPIYKLESLETVYEKYLQEHGNTFVSQLMKELRELPHTK